MTAHQKKKNQQGYVELPNGTGNRWFVFATYRCSYSIYITSPYQCCNDQTATRFNCYKYTRLIILYSFMGNTISRIYKMGYILKIHKNTGVLV